MRAEACQFFVGQKEGPSGAGEEETGFLSRAGCQVPPLLSPLEMVAGDGQSFVAMPGGSAPVVP